MKIVYICSKPSIMINVKLIAYNGAPESLFKSGKERFRELFPGVQFEFYSPEPDILVFLSGGSEKEAMRFVQPENFYLLTAFEENNSYAAASEVKTLLDQRQIRAMLTDLLEPHDRKIIQRYFTAKQGLVKLQGQNLALIGEVSDWLLASNIEAPLLKKKFGINLIKKSWDAVPPFENMVPEDTFLQKFQYHNQNAIAEAGKVHSALKQFIGQEKYDAFTIECFSLVKEKKVTACLSLSHFNDLDIPAGCEGDLCSITGMMLIRSLVGKIPWMANLIKVSTDCVRLAHCTAPASLLEHFEIDTHYETGLGTAIAGKFAAGKITLFRLNNLLTKVFISEGSIISTHKSIHACRTQIEVNIPEKDAEILKHHPLGNHHLIVPGSHKSLLKMACKIVGAELVNH
jgi:L-fucose isomerase-like protein